MKSGFGKIVGSGEVKEVKLSVDELMIVLVEMEEVLCYLESKLGKSKKFKMTRKEMVMEVIKDGELYSVKEIADRVGVMAGIVISSKNISSQLSYLREDFEKDGDKLSLVRVGRGHGKLKLIEM